MSRADPKNAVQLQTLENWRTSELERAQMQHARQQRVVEDKERAVEKVQEVIGESQSLARAQAQGAQIMSADTLTRIGHFTTVQLEELKQATSLLEQSQRQAADAKTSVVRKFEALSVVERLQARRATAVQRETLRTEQNRLDDQALMRSTRSNAGLKN